MFAIYYGFTIWVVCHEDGSLHSAHPNQIDAELCADLTQWIKDL